MKYIYTFIILLGFLGVTEAQQNFWKKIEENQFRSKGPRVIVPKQYAVFEIDELNFKSNLFKAPNEHSVQLKESDFILYLPMPDGTLQKFKAVESPVMADKLSETYPNIKTYNAWGIDDVYAFAKLDWNDFGFHGMIRSPLGDVYIDPFSNNDRSHYISYYKHDFEKPLEYRVSEVGLIKDNEDLQKTDVYYQNVAAACMGASLRTYRLAVANTYEYATRATGINNPTKSQVLSKVVTTVNRVDGVYQTEVAVKLVLIPNDTLIIYNTSADPFSGNNNGNVLIGESQSVINSTIGSANYDIGHTFSTGGGGLANLGCVCKSTSKASGITGSPNPVGDPYDIDYVAHEIGHQFGGNHTFASETGSCNGNRNTSTSQEPGSGVTIMGYAGICGSDNIAGNSIAYFHPVSYNEIVNYITVGSGKSCPVVTNTGNNPPVVTVDPVVYTIPIKTSFTLEGKASDPDGDPLTFSWEEIDNGPSAGGTWNSGNKPFFRSFVPVTDSSRTFPKRSNLLLGQYTPLGENFPTTAQTLNFQLTARDNKLGGGGICAVTKQLKVDAAGPFWIVSPNSTGVVYPSGSTQTLSWSVNGTDAGVINCDTVDIYISYDDALTFQPLLMKTLNDGSESITIPNLNADNANCRFKVKASNNIFFDINDRKFKITALSTGFNPISSSNQLGLLVSPNPFKQYFSLSVVGLNETAETNVVIYDLVGNLVYNKNFESKTEFNQDIDFSGLSSGVYFVKIRNKNLNAIQRIVKE
jgi:hypothetical protein